MKVDYAQEQEIMIGSTNAPLNLLMVANLNCYPCKVAYESLIELLGQYPTQINATFRFLLSGNTIHDIPASTFLIQYWEQYISDTDDKSEKTRQLIQDWYADMTTEAFENKYADKKISASKENDIAKSHYHWITKHEIMRTPTFFLNGYQYPSNYEIKDIGALISGLVPLLEEKNIVNKKAKELVL